MERKRGKCWKSQIFEGKLWVVISYLSKMRIVSMFYNSSYSSTFYSLFLPFFVLEIFKFKYDKVFVRHSASISKFEWFEQLCGWNLNKSKNLDETANVIDPYWKWNNKINKCFFGDSIIFCIAILMFLLGKEKSLLFILGKCL